MRPSILSWILFAIFGASSPLGTISPTPTAPTRANTTSYDFLSIPYPYETPTPATTTIPLDIYLYSSPATTTIPLDIYLLPSPATPTSTPLPHSPFYNLPDDDVHVALGNYKVVHSFSSIDAYIVILIYSDGSPAIQSATNPNLWRGSNLHPVCPLFCSDPQTDATVRGESCVDSCKEVSLNFSGLHDPARRDEQFFVSTANRYTSSQSQPHLDPNTLYVLSDAVTGVKGSELVYCPDQTTGVICSAIAPNPKVAYEA
ncbi:hypothetical protein MMC07_005322 [Pseudocyphellaria aurata]|nr:hypothetical protein [Pseudocyphellaria aurata]